jgi:hypothetical protein
MSAFLDAASRTQARVEAATGTVPGGLAGHTLAVLPGSLDDFQRALVADLFEDEQEVEVALIAFRIIGSMLEHGGQEAAAGAVAQAFCLGVFYGEARA